MTFFIKDTKTGKGLFTDSHIEKDHILFRVGGKEQNQDSEEPDISKNLLQIGDSKYLKLENHSHFFINHSCNPNTAVHVLINQAVLIALRQVLEGEEITFDYSSTSTDTKEQWSMKCNCGAWNCRKEISGFQYLNEDQKKFLIDRDAVPAYIIKGISDK